MVDRLDRLESLLERALSGNRNDVSSAEQQSDTGDANELTDNVNNGEPSLQNQQNISEMTDLLPSSATELMPPLLNENLPSETAVGPDEHVPSLPDDVHHVANSTHEVLLTGATSLFDDVSQSPINKSRSSSISNLEATTADAAGVPSLSRSCSSSSVEGDDGVSSGRWTPVSASSSQVASSALSIASSSAVSDALATEGTEYINEVVAATSANNNETEYSVDPGEHSVLDVLEETEYASQSSDGPAVPHVAAVVLESIVAEDRPEPSLLGEEGFEVFEDSYEESSSRRLDPHSTDWSEQEDCVQEEFGQDRDSFADQNGANSEIEEPLTPNGHSNEDGLGEGEESDEEEFEGIHAHLALQRLGPLRNHAAQSPFLSILEATAPKHEYELPRMPPGVVAPKTVPECIKQCPAEEEEQRQEENQDTKQWVQGKCEVESNYETPLPDSSQSDHEEETALASPPDSPSVADLIDHFSSPVLSRSVNRESRRLSCKRDSI